MGASGDRELGELEILKIQLDLSLKVSEAQGLDEILGLCARAAIQIAGGDSGGIYLFEPDQQRLRLVHHEGLSEGFARATRVYAYDTPNAQLVLAGRPLYLALEALNPEGDPHLSEEGLKAVAVIPIRHNNVSLGCINVASHTETTFSEFSQRALEITAAQVGDHVRRSLLEEELRFTQSNFQMVFEALRDFFFILDGAGRMVEMNRVFYERLGYGKAELIGRSVLEVHPSRSREQAREVLARILRGETDQYTLPLETRDGLLIPVQTFITEGTWRGAKAYIGVSRDITAQVEHEAERDQLLEQLHQAQKMEAIGRLAGGVAHDMNNVLTSINGIASVMQLDIEPGDPLNEDLQHILSACQRGQGLTKNLLGFARKGKFDPRYISLNEVVEEAVQLLKHSLPKGVLLMLHLASDLRLIQADSTQIVHALLNLALNASDAMEGSGELRIATRGIKRAPPGGGGRRDFICLEVCDGGCGMTPETMGHIFDAFFTTKGKGEGTGLGLSMVYGMMEAHGGWVEVESEEGAGACFKLFFPQAQGRREAPNLPRCDTPIRQAVLFVDDEDLVRTAGRRMLERMGYRVYLAGDGVEAVELYTEKQEDIALVLSDLNMPRMNGAEAFRALKAINPQIKVILLSGYFQEEAINALLREGVLGFVQKPYDFDTLKGKIEELLSESNPVNLLQRLMSEPTEPDSKAEQSP